MHSRRLNSAWLLFLQRWRAILWLLVYGIHGTETANVVRVGRDCYSLEESHCTEQMLQAVCWAYCSDARGHGIQAGKVCGWMPCVLLLCNLAGSAGSFFRVLRTRQGSRNTGRESCAVHVGRNCGGMDAVIAAVRLAGPRTVVCCPEVTGFCRQFSLKRIASWA